MKKYFPSFHKSVIDSTFYPCILRTVKRFVLTMSYERTINMNENKNFYFRDVEYTQIGLETRPEEAAPKAIAAEPSLTEIYPYYPPSYSASPEARRPAPKKQKSKNARFTAAVVTLCMFGSAVFGFGGTYLANSLNGASASETGAAPDNPSVNTVLYQSVIKTGADGKAAEKMSVEDVVANVKNSVVEITTETVSTSIFMRQFVSTGAGSGVIVSKDGYIVTNNHVVEDANAITVRLSDGSEYPAALVGTDAKTDLAVIKIEAEDLQPAVFGHSSELLAGQSAVAIGNPLGELGGTVTAGIISALDREITIGGKTMSLLQTDTAINPGNSGGGLFNLYGELVGIINAKSSGSEIEGLGFAIPIDTAKAVIGQLIEYGYVRGRIDTGLTLVDIQDAQTAMMYRVNQLGLYISGSLSGEFRSGDRIVAVGGNEVGSLADFNRQMLKYSVGDTVELSLVRGGQSAKASLTLTELKGEKSC